MEQERKSKREEKGREGKEGEETKKSTIQFLPIHMAGHNLY